MVVRVHDGALSEEYAVSSATLVVVEVCLQHVRITLALHVCDAEHRMLVLQELNIVKWCVYKTMQVTE